MKKKLRNLQIVLGMRKESIATGALIFKYIREDNCESRVT